MLDSLNAGAPASAKTLAALCDRVAVSLEAGIEIRRIWRSEAKRGSGRAAAICREVADAIEMGETLDEAITNAGPFFPPLFVELVRVGEQTGTTTEVFRRLGKHYEQAVTRARDFRGAIAWPLLQLLAALGIVAVLIAIGGLLNDGRGKPIDFLGFGLVGSKGVFLYLNGLIGLALVAGLSWMALRRSPDWTAWIRGKASRLPAIGSAIQKIALARIAWALRLTMNVELDMRRVAKVVLRASDNQRYAQHGGAVAASIEQGNPLSVAFEQTGVFPRRFIDVLEVSEETGMIVEQMDRLSKQYDEEAEHAVATLSTVFAFLIWAAVATLVILLIFRVFGFYTGVLNDAINGI